MSEAHDVLGHNAPSVDSLSEITGRHYKLSKGRAVGDANRLRPFESPCLGKRSSQTRRTMSAFGGKADIRDLRDWAPVKQIDQVYFPQTGMISLLVTSDGSAMVETSSVGREGAVGVQCGNGPCLSFTRAIVQIGGNFWIISAPRFEAATSRSAELRELSFAYIETLWAEAQQNAACNAIHDGSSRLCRWLLQCANRTGSDQVPLTQEFLAEMLGIAAHHSDTLGAGTAEARHSKI